MATRQEQVHAALHELYKRSNMGLMEPTIMELSATLEVVSKDLSPVFLVLDAMDECSEAFDVLKHLANLKKNICIAVTSRYLAEPDYKVSWHIHLDDMKLFHQDVAKYLQDKLSHRKLKPELFAEIVNQLSEGAQGQFPSAKSKRHSQAWITCARTTQSGLSWRRSLQDGLICARIVHPVPICTRT
ncbi:hypothetical protein BDP27DRAFT_1340294 [Rhodocollybia butyracea]|uniref:Nephrocystin 3-like N-terminal domain-containing protein n=1 Tax=Rhodocollybia butyracea TaxID=206335 RepID=A0A9P5P6X2_9AGAR|nr:hypothetical protein BDP27DRAFT_1340294 [Rhodocollybia butyracea]